MANDIHVTDGSILETLNNKVDLDGGNYPSSGLERYIDKTLNTRYDSKYLNRTQITNCLLEVPQRIKYTVGDGVITILAGSIIIVPYGTEDLTAQHPVGSVFLHDKFKVVETQFADGKFFVWVELQGNLNASDTTTKMIETSIVANITGGVLTAINTSLTTSSSSQGSGTTNTNYRTDLNIVQFIRNGALNSNVGSLPIIIAESDGTNLFASVKQVFNSMGYIGSTVWIDKGVKGLIPNGRNEDGTLRNIEFTIGKLIVNDAPGDGSRVLVYHKSSNLAFGRQPQTVHIQDSRPTITHTTTVQQWWFNPSENIMYRTMDTGATWEKIQGLFIGHYILDNAITQFHPYKPFKAIDKYEASGMGMPSSKHIDLTLGASGTVYVAPANGWFNILGATTVADGYVSIVNGNTTLGQLSQYNAKNATIRGYVPALAGQQVEVSYRNFSCSRFEFVYAQGEL